MNISLIFSLIFLTIGLHDQIPGTTETQTLDKRQTLAAVSDSSQMVTSIKGFLTWYKKNYKKANSFGLTGVDGGGNYIVNATGCKQYLAFLKSSGYISDTYTTLWQTYFNSKEEAFTINPQNEGPPEGFDFDLVLITQEPELIWNAIPKLKFRIIEHHGNKALIEMTGEWIYEIDLSKNKGKWQIDYIATTNFD
ncbi:MAG: hypothetical protein IPN29_06760 [Saprospiraceae bacterium]|nr:hypothetical protein [Saprospiraceae bacterium]